MTETASTTVYDEIAKAAPALSPVSIGSLVHTCKRIWQEVKDSDSETLVDALHKTLKEEWDALVARADAQLLDSLDATQLRSIARSMGRTYRLGSASKKDLARWITSNVIEEHAKEAKEYRSKVSAHLSHLSSMRWIAEKLDDSLRKIAQEEGETHPRNYRSMDVHEGSQFAVRQCARVYAKLRGDDVPDEPPCEQGKYAEDREGALRFVLQYALTALLREDLINNKSSAVQTRLQDLTREIGYMNGYRWVINACGYVVGQDAHYSYPHLF